jgi:hypothetical protein
VRRLVACLGLALVLVGVAPDAAPALATHTAGVTVSYGDGRVVRRTVSFTAASISGIAALQGAGFGAEVYGYSGLGAAVCRIDGVGRAPDASCLNGGTEYWAYWQNGTYSRVGAGATRVEDGDQEQWAWGSGTSAPPTTAFPAATTVPPPTHAPVTQPPGPAAPGGSTGPEATPTTASGSTGSTASSSTTTGGPAKEEKKGGTTASTEAGNGGEVQGDAAPAGDVAGEEAGGALASSTRPADDGSGSPFAVAAFVVVLAAVLALTVRARSARGSDTPRK